VSQGLPQGITTMSEQVRLPVKLSFKKEGDMVNAYLVRTDKDHDIQLVASVHVAVVSDEDRWESFKILMRETVADMIEESTGARPTMEERLVPDYEKSGNC
jgi:hypothetical protein